MNETDEILDGNNNSESISEFEKDLNRKNNFFSNIKNVYKIMFGKKKVTDIISASDAYLQAKYGNVKTKEERYTDFIEELNSLIMFKCQNGEFFCTIEMPIELVDDYLNDTIEKYAQLGYKLFDMRTVVDTLDRCVLFICWEKIIC